VADWRVEILDDEPEARLSLREDARRYGVILFAFVLGWLLASLTPVRLPLP
jgi:hypothetical protein